MSEHPFGGGRRRPARLWKAAALAAHHPYYLAGLLEAFREGENMSDAELAQYLGCPTEALPQLALCRRPEPSPPGFRSDVETIARRFGLDAKRLAHVVRTADFLLRAASAQGRPTRQLLAARELDADEDNGPQAR